MFNILVVEDNINQCKNLVNLISQTNYNIKLYHMAFSGKEALEVIISEKIDFIILDLNLPDMSGVDIIEKLEKEELIRYKNCILVISGQEEMISKICNSSYVYKYMYKPYNIDALNNYINEMIEDKEVLIKDKKTKQHINSELKKLNFDYALLGTKYLEDCIFEAYNKNIENSYNLKKDLYPIIAKKYNTSVHNIKCRINRATENMYYQCPIKVLQNYLEFNIDEKPKTKLIIYSVLDKLAKSQ